MPTDALIQLQASTTQTATFSGSAVVLAGGTPRRGLKARVIVTASSGAGSVIFGIGVSRDAGSTWNIEFQGDPLTLATNGAIGEYFIPFDVSPSSIANGVQVRLTCTYTSTGSITYGGEMSQTRP